MNWQSRLLTQNNVSRRIIKHDDLTKSSRGIYSEMVAASLGMSVACDTLVGNNGTTAHKGNGVLHSKRGRRRIVCHGRRRR